MIRSLLTCVILLSAAVAYAASVEVDRAEVLRMGNLVQPLGQGIGAAGTDAFVEAMGPPASDADKWFISVLSMRGCGACEQLKRDWATSRHLLALAHPNEPKESWAHYNVYLREDRSQAFRFENLKVTAYPTVLVQPPRNGRYGDPKTVVFQSVYGGNPEQLAENITRAIRLYVSKFEATQVPRHAAGAVRQGPVGIDPPWQPAPQVDPFVPSVTPAFPNARPLIPPIFDERKPLFEIPWASIITALATGVSLPVIIAVAIWLIYFIREKRKAAGKPLLLDDETLERLVELLREVAQSEAQTKRTTRTTSTRATRSR